MFHTFLNLPRNVWVLTLTLALAQGAMPLLVLTSGLLGARLAPNEKLATLPLALSLVGLASSTIPAAFFAKRWGRKAAAMMGPSIALTGIICCAGSAWLKVYSLLLIGTLLVGASSAFYQQFRFAAIESLSDAADTGPALSALMISGIIAGVLGPQLTDWGQILLPNLPEFVAAFILMAALIVCALVVLALYLCHTVPYKQNVNDVARPLSVIVTQPLFLIALFVALASYVMMSFIMTSTPISMHMLHGHSLSDSKWVIQSHVVAMFLPSLFSGLLLKRFGAAPLLIVGSILYLLVIAVAFSGHDVVHYWWALVCLGVGWNFLFITGTSLLPQTYRRSERFKAQAVNDFTIFTTQAIASLGAGWVLFRFGWTTQLLICLPIALVCLVVAVFYTITRGKNRSQTSC